jgi:hypothetical protein
VTTTAGTCKARNKRGEPCQAHALKGNEYCWHHAPERAAERARAHSLGGKARHGRRLSIGEPPPAALQTAQDALELLEYGARVALALEPSHNQVRSLVALVTAWRTVHDVAELQAQLSAIEARLARLEAKWEG